MRQILRRIAYLFHRRQHESDLAEEMACHREMKERELARSGHPAADIAPAANRALGSMTLARERSSDVWVWPWLEHLLYDVRLALRGLRRPFGACVS